MAASGGDFGKISTLFRAFGKILEIISRYLCARLEPVIWSLGSRFQSRADYKQSTEREQRKAMGWFGSDKLWLVVSGRQAEVCWTDAPTMLKIGKDKEAQNNHERRGARTN